MKAVRRSGAGHVSTPRVVRSGTMPTDVSGPFVCGWSAVGDCAVVRVAGRIDKVSAPTFETELHRVITTKRPTLVVDLRRVSHMDRAGIEVLKTAGELAVQHDGWLRIAGAAAWLAELLSDLGERIRQYPSLADALPSYRPAPST